MTAKRLQPNDIAALSISLPQWQLVNGKLHRELVFANFVEAYSFMSQVA